MASVKAMADGVGLSSATKARPRVGLDENIQQRIRVRGLIRFG
jgi:hypothetical protein